ncbi:MAG: hypothetical protein RLY93_19770 [Sumerlaeia bacterium]
MTPPAIVVSHGLGDDWFNTVVLVTNTMNSAIVLEPNRHFAPEKTSLSPGESTKAVISIESKLIGPRNVRIAFAWSLEGQVQSTEIAVTKEGGGSSVRALRLSTEIDVGLVLPDSSIKFRIPIANDSNFPIVIGSPKTPCECTVPESWPAVIAPQEKEYLTFSVHFPNRNGPYALEPAAFFLTSDPGAPFVSLNLHATVGYQITAEPSRIQIEDLDYREASNFEVLLKGLSSEADLGQVEIVGGRWVKFEEGRPVNGGLQLHFSAKPYSMSSFENSEIWIRSVEGGILSKVPVFLTHDGPVQASPGEVHLLIDGTASGYDETSAPSVDVTVRSKSGPLRILATESDVDWLEIIPVQESGETLVLKYRPNRLLQVGDFRTSTTVKLVGESEEFAVPIPVHFYSRML